MSFFEFPHTRTYDSDLGWLIKEFTHIRAEYEELKEFVEKYPEDFSGLDNRIRTLENSFDTFEAQIESRFSQLETSLNNEISRQISIGLAEIDRAIGEMRAALIEIRAEVEQMRSELTAEVRSYYDLSTYYTDAKIQELINSLPDLRTVYVFNPVKGEITTIQIAVNDLYDLARPEALTALEYDSLGLTAAEYDSLELTALQYDRYGLYYMELMGYYHNPFHYMTSPFTGETVRLEIVINELTSLHKDDALTASEYDALSLDADYYDSLELSAYDYDWHGKTLVA